MAQKISARPSARPMQACRICGNTLNHRGHIAREMMYGKRDEFRYLECGSCGCLQLLDIPPDLSAYYPADYHAAPRSPRPPNRLKQWLKEVRGAHAFGRRSALGAALVAIWGSPPLAQMLRPAGITLGSSVLDIGCGRGDRLAELYGYGFRNLLGVDRFIAADIPLGSGCKVLRQPLEATEGRFDLIMMHHSLEHMPDPQATLREAVRLLAPTGWLLVRVPLADSYAWRTYRVDWYQLDAPRHLYLYTRTGLNLLAAEAGLEVAEVVFDSDAQQLWASEQYRRDIPLRDRRSYFMDPVRSVFTSAQIAAFQRQAEQLNESGEGDQACFFLRKQAGMTPAASLSGPHRFTRTVAVPALSETAEDGH